MAKALPTPHESILIIYDDGKKREGRVLYNAIPVKLPQYDHKLYFSVEKGFGMKPIMHLPSCPVDIYDYVKSSMKNRIGE